jgi:ectoine hydroxylase-related dioxygenase (phytanoyl-CoA dioxygenase family)
MKSFNLANNFTYQEICVALESDGVVIVENFLNEESCDAIASILEGQQLANSNELTFVNVLDSRFFSNALGVSKEAFDLVTRKEVLEISRNYLKQEIRLKCHRAYTTKNKAKFPWHTDNKFDGIKNDVFGIVFIVYLVDTYAGGTEFVLGSHKFSHKYKHNNYFDNDIRNKYNMKIARTEGKKGTVVISDTRTIHRGGYSNEKNIDRKSFWFQVESNMQSAERLLLNPEFLPARPPEELTRYLGFGLPFGLTVHPHTTNIDLYLSPKIIIQNYLRFTRLIAKIPIFWLKSILSADLKAKIKRNLNISKSDWN